MNMKKKCGKSDCIEGNIWMCFFCMTRHDGARPYYTKEKQAGDHHEQ